MRYVAVRIACIKYGQSANEVLPICAAGGGKRNESPPCDVYTEAPPFYAAKGMNRPFSMSITYNQALPQHAFLPIYGTSN
ncbi:MAG: hypothetical protein F4Y91_22905 [Gemmatimonadetes bacterium]|nr:hypothetical protein [Gemmatimonadota bacterium]MYB68921.1 hypothetical protein [Gemmatimonadota bacterium]